MHLRSAVLRNFRCFEELEIRFHERLTVLVAENGGGKTAVLDAIAIGLSPLLQRLSTAHQRLSGPGFADTDFRLATRSPQAGNTPEPSNPSTTDPDALHDAPGEEPPPADFSQVIIETTDNLRWDYWKPSAQGRYPREEIGQADLARHVSRILEQLQASRPGILLPVVAYYGATRGWIEVPKRLRKSRSTAIDYARPTSALVDALKSSPDFRELLLWFDAREADELRANRSAIKHDMDRFTPSPELEEVREAIVRVLGSGYANPRFDRRHRFVVDGPEGHPLQVTQLSQGYQSMLALAMDFARRLAVANPWMRRLTPSDPLPSSVQPLVHWIDTWGPFVDDRLLGPFCAPAIMLVDEIDLHLHPSWQQRVLSDLMRAFPATQFIVTTHSPQVLSTVKRECIRELVLGAEGHWIARVPPGEETWGVESSDALRSVFGVDPVPPVEPATWYRDYLRSIELGTHAEPAGDTLRRKLLELYGPNHPLMLDAERLLRFQEMKRRAASTQG